MKDFFISYNKADRDWAEWIAWTLEEAGHSVVIQAWDFRPGENFVLKMQKAAVETEKTIAVLSQDYLKAEFTQPEWAEAFNRDPQGKERTLIPVRVRDCTPPGLLSPTILIDLVGNSGDDAREELLKGIGEDRAKPMTAPPFPGGVGDSKTTADRVMPNPVPYPGTVVSADNSSKRTIVSNLPTGIPFFTGREEVLTQLQEALESTGATALAQRQAISGLGGIGKTQTAIEYARRHRSEYKALVWAVAESEESLISDFEAIANVLKLPEANAPDQTFVVTAVKRWLETNREWLLILDNADDPALLEDFLPESLGGHLLLTSRAQVFDALGILNPIELEEMTPDDAKDFLLRRTGRTDPSDDEAHALTDLAKELDYLPLALEQAGAYIKELRSSFHDYLASYHQRGLELLEKGSATSKYRKSVRTTWSLNFQQVEQTSKASADMLRASAFLNPDRIPVELFAEAAVDLGPELSVALANVRVDPLGLDEILQPLIQYSLVHRDRSLKTYDIHRLVQAVLKEGMDESTRLEWAHRLVRAFARILPDVDSIDVSGWDRIERFLPHTLACAELIKIWKLRSQEAAHLLNLTGRYLHNRGRLRETAPLYQEALTISGNVLEAGDVGMATSLRNQAWLCFDQGKYGEAARLGLESLSITEKALGPFHLSLAKTLIILGRIYQEQGRSAEAKRCGLKSLEITKHALGLESLETAESLSWAADFALKRGNFYEAETLAEEALELREKRVGKDNIRSTNDLYTLATVRSRQRRYAEAENLLVRAILIIEKTFGLNYPRLATFLGQLARIRIAENKYPEAETLLNRSLKMVEEGLGAEHPETGTYCNECGNLYRKQGEYRKAEVFHRRALAIEEKTGGSDTPRFGIYLGDLASLYLAERKYSTGEPIARKGIPILKNSYGLESETVVNAMLIHAALLKGMNRKGEAQRLEAQAKKIAAKLKKAERSK